MKIVYWIFTILLAALMFLSAIPDVLMVDGAVQIFEHLGYPRYLLPFIGVAKILGAAAILQPWFRSLTEWAYAGITFDNAPDGRRLFVGWLNNWQYAQSMTVPTTQWWRGQQSEPRELTPDLLDAACHVYFVRDEPAEA